MTEFISVDVSNSERLAALQPGNIQPKECYDNVARLVTFSPEINELFPGIRVVYGGVQIFPGEEISTQDMRLFNRLGSYINFSITKLV